MGRRKEKIAEEKILRACDQLGCLAGGQYRAPKGKNRLDDYYWFCLDHVRLYNKSWDFYAGMGPEEIEAEIRRDIVGRRPTWPLGARRSDRHAVFGRKLGRGFVPDDIEDSLANHFGVRSKKKMVKAKIDDPENEALAVLGLIGPVSFAEVRKAYKILAKTFHPDANGGSKIAEEKLKTINQAYNLLKGLALQIEPALG